MSGKTDFKEALRMHLNFLIKSAGVEKKIEFEDIHAHLIRQMAYELLNSPALVAIGA